MGRTYNPQAFIKTISQKTEGKNIICPVCGGTKFTSTEYLSSVLIGTDTKDLNLGPTIPAGMLICQKCGHIDFFALGALGLLDHASDEEK